MRFSSPTYFLIGVLFVALLMISNTVAVKIVQIGPLTVAGAILLFPFTYIFGDILTEVYGYRGSRLIIWTGFGACLLMATAYILVQYLPAAVFWKNQTAYETILGQTPRIVLASLFAYLAGEFSNSYILSRMKVVMRGKHLWMRTIGSTVVGEGVDSILFGLLAFVGFLPWSAVVSIIISGYLVKVAIEIIMTPATYRIVKYLKMREQTDVYDANISYNPFLLTEPAPSAKQAES